MSGAPTITDAADPKSVDGPLGILCGSGVAPIAVADTVAKTGRPVVLFGFQGFADPERIKRFPHEWIALGQFGRFKRLAREHGCRDFVWVGGLVRPRLGQIRFDFGTVLMLPDLLKAFRGGDNHMLTTLGAFFERHGFRVRSIQEIAPQMLAPEGVMTARAPSEADREDISIGFDLIAATSRFDVGQAAIIARKHVLAIEAIEGTDGMLRHAAELRRQGRIRSTEKIGVLVKAAKRGQDLRFDLPTIGPDTIAGVAAAGFGGVAVAAGQAIVVDVGNVIAEADRAGLFLVGIKASDQ
ncbi:MAG: LpxI family protein [Pseudolabrys sp.]